MYSPNYRARNNRREDKDEEGKRGRGKQAYAVLGHDDRGSSVGRHETIGVFLGLTSYVSLYFSKMRMMKTLFAIIHF